VLPRPALPVPNRGPFGSRPRMGVDEVRKVSLGSFADWVREESAVPGGIELDPIWSHGIRSRGGGKLGSAHASRRNQHRRHQPWSFRSSLVPQSRQPPCRGARATPGPVVTTPRRVSKCLGFPPGGAVPDDARNVDDGFSAKPGANRRGSSRLWLVPRWEDPISQVDVQTLRHLGWRQATRALQQFALSIA
jgi:hypothetical protein